MIITKTTNEQQTARTHPYASVIPVRSDRYVVDVFCLQSGCRCHGYIAAEF